MEGARAHFHVERLLDDAAALGPELLEGQNQPLEGCYIGLCLFAHGVHLLGLR